MRQTAEAALARDRGNINNQTPTPVFEGGNRGLTGEKDPFGVDRKGQVPGIFGHLFDFRHIHHARVTDHDVETAQRAGSLLDHTQGIALLSHVGLNRQ